VDLWLHASASGFYRIRSTIIFAILSAALPSHSGGSAPFLRGLSSRSIIASRRGSRSGRTRRLVPISQVTGRSVVVRSVRHGMPSAVVSSWIPPGIGKSARDGGVNISGDEHKIGLTVEADFFEADHHGEILTRNSSGVMAGTGECL